MPPRSSTPRRRLSATRRRGSRTQSRAFGEESVAIVQVLGEYELDVVADLAPERVAGRQRPPQPALRADSARGPACAARSAPGRPTPGPRASSPASRPRKPRGGSRESSSGSAGSGPATPPGHKGWTQHLAALRRRAARLTKLDLKELHVVDEGTDLRLKIAPFSIWRGGGEEDHWGRKIAMNVPTEECFISPDAAATEGTFRCSRPRSFGGRMIEGLAGEFRGGRLVRLEAKREADRDWLARYLAATPNADRLGEIALVDASSRIGQTGRIYYNGLLDENAAAHMAFGSGFAKTRTVPIGRKRFGVNRSRTHIDVMIGTDALNAFGVTQTGTPRARWCPTAPGSFSYDS